MKVRLDIVDYSLFAADDCAQSNVTSGGNLTTEAAAMINTSFLNDSSGVNDTCLSTMMNSSTSQSAAEKYWK